MNDALVHATLSRTTVLFNDLRSVTSVLFVCKLIFSTLLHTLVIVHVCSSVSPVLVLYCIASPRVCNSWLCCSCWSLTQ